MILIPGQNRLADPEIVDVPQFENQLADFKKAVVDYIAQSDEQMAVKVEESLSNESEVLTKLLEVSTVMLLAERRHKNEQIKQMLAWWATDSNLDAKAADMGLERQVIEEGDPDAYPPLDPVLESDDHLRLRYFLAPHAPAAGSRMHYKYEALTLSSRASVSVEPVDEGEVVVRYRFSSGSAPSQIKDANGRRDTAGVVFINVLARDGDGTPSESLLSAVREHFSREDVVTLNDIIQVRGAQIINYRIAAVVYIYPGADSESIRDECESLLQEYAGEQHVLGGGVEDTWCIAKLHQAGAAKVELSEPLASIDCDDHQAPFCESIYVEVRTL